MNALLPILVFLVLYIGCGIYYEYVSPIEGGMGFYVMSVVVAFMISLIVAFFQNRSLDFNQKIHICAKGIGDDNITIMLFIFLMAGAFSGIAGAAGGVKSTANLLLNFIPGQFVVPGMFVIAAFISMAMGTSVGTISVLVPIAAEASESGNIPLALCTASVVGGAMFGDNLSFISDTTIAATRTQGVQMKDKFRANVKISLPASIISLIFFTVYSLRLDPASMGSYEFNLLQAIPYFIVLIMAVIGINVFTVLGIGILLFAAAGAISGSLSFNSAFTAMGDGTSGMFETMIVTILVASIASLIRENGGFEAVLQFVKNTFRSKKGGMLGISIITMLMDMSTANNTVAIVMTGPIAKQISDEYKIEPAKTASILDICSCVMQGIIPYGAQLLIAAGLSGISALHIIPYLFYPYILFVCLMISIALEKNTVSANA
ncbi:MAG: Na+/H+ antiporter NhaC family protein [Lachnospiraceae bacterium]|nr:Na+/H+ antiporter NhaC family protein [Lachnospiraceae bacterium]